MSRRWFLVQFLSFGALARKPEAAIAPVTDVDKLNGFAVEYNAYVAKLQRNVLDVKLWSRVLAAWQKITG